MKLILSLDAHDRRGGIGMDEEGFQKYSDSDDNDSDGYEDSYDRQLTGDN